LFLFNYRHVNDLYKVPSQSHSGYLWNDSYFSDRSYQRGRHSLLPASTSLLPKSTSLPAIASAAGVENKYKYKSSLKCQEEIDEDEYVDDCRWNSGGSVDESVVEKFIRVVETREPTTSEVSRKSVNRKCKVNTREDIRKKLAFGGGNDSSGGERANGYKRGFQETNDLQICFINEGIVFSEDEDEQQEQKQSELEKEDSSEDCVSDNEDDDEDDDDDCVFPRSKSDWDSFRHGSGDSAGNRSQEQLTRDRRIRREEKQNRVLRKRLQQLQKEVKLNLQDCRQIAKRQIEKAKQKRLADDPLRQLIGLPSSSSVSTRSFDEETLQTFNIAKLQVIVNHFHSEVERLNEELVRALLNKDELQIEQDGQLVDIEDLSCSFKSD
jgi:hypothetical protein